jgi:NAD(P)-dependent dehydrogenase (short-subunit alcohol dehydrogenase family)
MGTAPVVPRGWGEDDIAPLTSRRYLVTGATSGLGRATAAALSSRGAHVTITARDADKARAVLAAGAAHDVLAMDLADLASVRRAASLVSEPYDVVILNAGIMWTPYALTRDGFEAQVGTNHLGHFALAGLLADRITQRVVSVASLYHRYGSFGDGSLEEIRRRCEGQGPYDARRAYADSKLANLLFVEEIQRRRLRHGWPFIALSAHPGWSHTHLFDTAASTHAHWGRAASLASRVLAQRATRGALPILAAATWEGVVGGEYLGPRGPGELRGSPRVVAPIARAHDAALAQNLWRVSQDLTGVTWS